MSIAVPWNASWTSEDRYEVRPCRYVGGALAIWSPHTPGLGKPLFAKPHMVRQRRSIAEFRCTVCGEKTELHDRFWFGLGEFREGWFMTTEAPVHHQCAQHALKVCPHLRNRSHDLDRLPGGFSILSAVVGGRATECDFKVRLSSYERVVGHLKLAWPADSMRAYFSIRDAQKGEQR